MDGILASAPIADLLAMLVTAGLTVAFFMGIKRMAAKSRATNGQDSTVIKPSKEGVIITIARQHGSSGKQIGKIVAEKLEIPFYYKEMTALAAQESGLDKEFISDINANSPDVLRSLYLSCEVVQQAITAQDKIIRKIADNGSCVIVGRAADYVLRNYKDVVRIYIYAPEEYRVKRIMEVYGDSEEEAKKNLRRSDKARAAYYANISTQKWGDSKHYDLCVDSSIGVKQSADLIVSYVQAKTPSVNA